MPKADEQHNQLVCCIYGMKQTVNDKELTIENSIERTDPSRHVVIPASSQQVR